MARVIIPNVSEYVKSVGRRTEAKDYFKGVKRPKNLGEQIGIALEYVDKTVGNKYVQQGLDAIRRNQDPPPPPLTEVEKIERQLAIIDAEADVAAGLRRDAAKARVQHSRANPVAPVSPGNIPAPPAPPAQPPQQRAPAPIPGAMPSGQVTGHVIPGSMRYPAPAPQAQAPAPVAQAPAPAPAPQYRPINVDLTHKSMAELQADLAAVKSKYTRGQQMSPADQTTLSNLLNEIDARNERASPTQPPAPEVAPYREIETPPAPVPLPGEVTQAPGGPTRAQAPAPPPPAAPNPLAAVTDEALLSAADRLSEVIASGRGTRQQQQQLAAIRSEQDRRKLAAPPPPPAPAPMPAPATPVAPPAPPAPKPVEQAIDARAILASAEKADQKAAAERAITSLTSPAEILTAARNAHTPAQQRLVAMAAERVDLPGTNLFERMGFVPPSGRVQFAKDVLRAFPSARDDAKQRLAELRIKGQQEYQKRKQENAAALNKQRLDLLTKKQAGDERVAEIRVRAAQAGKLTHAQRDRKIDNDASKAKAALINAYANSAGVKSRDLKYRADVLRSVLNRKSQVIAADGKAIERVEVTLDKEIRKNQPLPEIKALPDFDAANATSKERTDRAKKEAAHARQKHSRDTENQKRAKALDQAESAKRGLPALRKKLKERRKANDADFQTLKDYSSGGRKRRRGRGSPGAKRGGTKRGGTKRGRTKRGGTKRGGTKPLTAEQMAERLKNAGNK